VLQCVAVPARNGMAANVCAHMLTASTHKHTYTCTRTHAHYNKHTHTHTRTNTHKQYVHTHTRTHTHPRASTHTSECGCVRAQDSAWAKKEHARECEQERRYTVRERDEGREGGGFERDGAKEERRKGGREEGGGVRDSEGNATKSDSVRERV